MPAHRSARAVVAALALTGSLLAAGCGRGATVTTTTSYGVPVTVPPALGAPKAGREPAPEREEDEPIELGLPVLATKNTTRIAASDPVAVAAGAALTVFPGLTPESRPGAVVVVDKRDWRAALAASVLMSEPLRAPMLLSGKGEELPATSRAALAALKPTGSKAAGGAKLIRVGDVPRAGDLQTTDVRGADPFALARALDAFHAAARGKVSERVIVVSADEPAYAAPAAAYAAKSGDPILFTRKDGLPAATRAALATHRRPAIYVLGPENVISAKAEAQLRTFGTVKRVGAPGPLRNAIAFATFSAPGFGWGIVDPGHGLVFTRATGDPAIAAAAAPLSASGTYGPLLLVNSAQAIDPALRDYLKAIQPGYRSDPVRGVYNHGWLVGDQAALSPALQARLDTLLEIMPAQTATVETP